MRYGFIGLGNLGGHLAASLLREGFAVTVHDRDEALAGRHLAAGAGWAATPEAVAAASDAVFTCLPSPAVSEAVLLAMLPAMRGRDWVEMSTLGRNEILRLGAMAEAAGAGCLECPVTGGVHLAKQGRKSLRDGIHLLDKYSP